MSKDNDIDELLGDTKPAKAKGTDALKAAKAPKKAAPVAEFTPPAKAAKPKAEAKVATPTKKAPKAAPAKPKAKAEVVERAAKDPIEWADGEKEKLTKKLLDKVRKEAKGINSKDTAEFLGISTRKQRPLLYSLQRSEHIVLKPGDSPVAGMLIKIGKAGK
jgi:hypothetical protein